MILIAVIALGAIGPSAQYSSTPPQEFEVYEDPRIAEVRRHCPEPTAEVAVTVAVVLQQPV